MNRPSYLLVSILVAFFVTFMLRALPFMFFNGEKKMPIWLEQLGKALPSSIMAVLVVYCLKGVKGDPIGIGLPSLVASLIVVLSYKWRRNTFLSIILGTTLYMVLLRFF
ncbi:MAG: AzlD domain-containing protein [Oscillospiraceae bacterium]|nr:AzlD domain-containing protein [Oscillospiraceae bacterium]